MNNIIMNIIIRKIKSGNIGYCSNFVFFNIKLVRKGNKTIYGISVY